MNPVYLFVPIILAFLSTVLLKTKRNLYNSNLFFTLLGGGFFIFYTLPYILELKEKRVSTWWMIDGLSALMAVLIAFVFVTSLVVGLRYIGHELDKGIITFVQYKTYFALFQLFVFCMFLAVLTNNSLLLWLALEGTTLFSTFLVGIYRKQTSIEAAWKYMILCSTGISMGLLGILLLNYGAHVAGVESNGIFLISSLMENAKLIPEGIVKISFIFLFIGFGTKVGLVPMHTWLPDAHSKAPSPISAIFSAVLLNVALYCILRFKFVVDSSLGDSAWTNNLFLIFGFISIIFSALMILIQENYKRMLAYSSIEHMGLAIFAIALSPLGAVFGLMHIIGHTLNKSTLFFGAGEILTKYNTTKISGIKNMLTNMKITSIFFIVGILAIVAMPTSIFFVSEFGMFSQSVIKFPKTTIALFVALGIIAFSMLKLTISMVFSKGKTAEASNKKESWNITHTVMLIQLSIIFILAFYFITNNGLILISNIVDDFLFIK